MAEPRKRTGSVVVGELPALGSSSPAAEQETVVGIQSALGRETYTWTSPYASDVVVQFCRPKGGTREMVLRVLGPEQSQNAAIFREFMALASITHFRGEEIRQPTTLLTFRALKQRVGWTGPAADDWFDEPIAAFTFAYECAMYPDQLRIAAELEGSGLSPDDEKRILKNAGLDRPKTSPNQPS
jgi:hypothetical protein